MSNVACPPVCPRSEVGCVKGLVPSRLVEALRRGEAVEARVRAPMVEAVTPCRDQVAGMGPLLQLRYNAGFAR